MDKTFCLAWCVNKPHVSESQDIMQRRASGKKPTASAGSLRRNIWEWIQDWIGRAGRRPKIGLALGSGASWGVAHIGVLSVFQELDIPISFLAGSSSGAFVGALYAGGVEGDPLLTCGRDYRWRDAGRLNYVPRMGLATNDRMVSYLQKRIGQPRFEELRIPLHVTATNLATGQLTYFHRGPVIPAVRASCAIPGIFAPVEIDGDLYCDGGILNKIPCNVLRDAGADVVIAVQLISTQKSKPPTNIFEVINRAFSIALFRQVDYDCQAADLILQPDVNGIYEFGFDQNDALLERGRRAAFDQLGQWRQLHLPVAEPRKEKTPVRQKR